MFIPEGKPLSATSAQALQGPIDPREIALKSRSAKMPQSLRLCKLCGARSKNGNGPCSQPAMANGRCRFHGGKTPPTPKGSQFALKHGAFTAEAIAQRRKLNEVLRAAYALLKQVDERVAKRLHGAAAYRNNSGGGRP